MDRDALSGAAVPSRFHLRIRCGVMVEARPQNPLQALSGPIESDDVMMAFTYVNATVQTLERLGLGGTGIERPRRATRDADEASGAA